MALAPRRLPASERRSRAPISEAITRMMAHFSAGWARFLTWVRYGRRSCRGGQSSELERFVQPAAVSLVSARPVAPKRAAMELRHGILVRQIVRQQ